jgi:hypothetical protein
VQHHAQRAIPALLSPEDAKGAPSVGEGEGRYRQHAPPILDNKKGAVKERPHHQ